MVVTNIDKGVPLVVTGTVGSHPGSEGLTTGILYRLIQEMVLVCALIKLHRSQLHIIHPVVFLVDVGREYRGGLTDTGLLSSRLIGGFCFAANLLGKIRIERLEQAGSLGKAGGKLTCSRRGVPDRDHSHSSPYLGWADAWRHGRGRRQSGCTTLRGRGSSGPASRVPI